MEVFKTIVTVLEVIASIAMILVVLFQSGKEDGLSGAISGNTESYMNKGNRSTLDAKLASATKWIAIVFMILTLALNIV